MTRRDVISYMAIANMKYPTAMGSTAIGSTSIDVATAAITNTSNGKFIRTLRPKSELPSDLLPDHPYSDQSQYEKLPPFMGGSLPRQPEPLLRTPRVHKKVVI